MDKCYVCRKKDIEPRRVNNFPELEIKCEYCGNYQITTDAIDLNVLEKYRDQIYLLSAAIKRKTSFREMARLSTESIPELIKTVNRKLPLAIIDDLIEYVSKKVDSIDSQIEFNENDVPRFTLKDANELFEYIVNITELGYWGIVSQGQGKAKIKLTLNGWKKIEEIHKTKSISDQAFVAMWFDDSMDKYYQEGIKPALIKTGFNPIINVKEIQHNEQIDDLIFAQIRRSGLMIVDFTGNRPAVYYEAGFARGLGIPVIWLCKKSDEGNLCFDTRQYNHIIWNDTEDLLEKLVNRIEATIPGHLIEPNIKVLND